MNELQRCVKRLIDIIGATLGLLLLSPAYIIIFFLLKKKESGSVLFRQERIGMGGKPFVIYKYRTMKEESEVDGPRLAEQGDSRLTPFGKFLREHHLDELPQLWNVLIGDMSLVGPRPERKFFIDKIMKLDSRYEYLYELRPGLTSEATLHNGYTDTMEKMLERLELDIKYLKTRSLVSDFKIITETVTSIVFGKKF